MLALRLTTISVPSLLVTDLRLLNLRTPSFLASILDRSAPPMAMPPTWKVRMVSWVPGSPIDWAATMPQASPSSTILPEAGERP